LRDWLLTLPVVLLVPAILVPLIVLGTARPTLTASSAAPGGNLTVNGGGFGRKVEVALLWDGDAAGWLPQASTDRDGRFTLVVRVPKRLLPGVHTLTAVQLLEKPSAENDSKLAASRTGRTASTTVTIGAPASPSPSAASPTPSPTAKPTPSDQPTAKPTPVPSASSEPPAPPPVGVAGYGAGTAGGRGGAVVTVTNLNDSGPGSLRAAAMRTGPRTVVFATGGTIDLSNDLLINDPFLTIDGSTAPRPIVIRGGAVRVITHDVILRNLRMRPGDRVAAPGDVDAVTLNGLSQEVHDVVLDHLTMIWGPDIGGLAILGNVHDVTVQYSIMGEGLYLSAHPEGTTAEGGHSMAASIFQLYPNVQWARRLTFHHNLFTTSNQRMPVVQGAECVDLVNNVIYDWGTKPLHGNPRAMNVVNNWFRSGPQTTTDLVYEWQHHEANPNPYPNSVYLDNNVADGFKYDVSAPDSVLRTSAACGGLSVRPDTAQAGYDTVIRAAGAILPVRDSVDDRIIANVINRTGSFFDGAGYKAPNPYWP
jgi:pectate lyase